LCIGKLKKGILAEKFRLTVQSKVESKDIDYITGKTPLIIKEIWLFPNLDGIIPFIFHMIEFPLYQQK
jgi:hypothetical protein